MQDKFLFALPDYVLNGLRATGLTLPKLANTIDALSVQSPTHVADVKSFLASKISKYDLEDTLMLNTLLSQNFNLPCVMEVPVHNKEALERLLEQYYDPSVDLASLEGEVFDLYVETTFMLFVPKVGFGNVLKADIKHYRTYFLNHMLKIMFRNMREEDVYNTTYFERLNQMCYANAIGS